MRKVNLLFVSRVRCLHRVIFIYDIFLEETQKEAEKLEEKEDGGRQQTKIRWADIDHFSWGVIWRETHGKSDKRAEVCVHF